MAGSVREPSPRSSLLTRLWRPRSKRNAGGFADVDMPPDSVPNNVTAPTSPAPSPVKAKLEGLRRSFSMAATKALPRSRSFERSSSESSNQGGGQETSPRAMGRSSSLVRVGSRAVASVGSIVRPKRRNKESEKDKEDSPSPTSVIADAAEISGAVVLALPPSVTSSGPVVSPSQPSQPAQPAQPAQDPADAEDSDFSLRAPLPPAEDDTTTYSKEKGRLFSLAIDRASLGSAGRDASPPETTPASQPVVGDAVNQDPTQPAIREAVSHDVTRPAVGEVVARFGGRGKFAIGPDEARSDGGRLALERVAVQRAATSAKKALERAAAQKMARADSAPAASVPRVQKESIDVTHSGALCSPSKVSDLKAFWLQQAAAENASKEPAAVPIKVARKAAPVAQSKATPPITSVKPTTTSPDSAQVVSSLRVCSSNTIKLSISFAEPPAPEAPKLAPPGSGPSRTSTSTTHVAPTKTKTFGRPAEAPAPQPSSRFTRVEMANALGYEAAPATPSMPAAPVPRLELDLDMSVDGRSCKALMAEASEFALGIVPYSIVHLGDFEIAPSKAASTAPSVVRALEPDFDQVMEMGPPATPASTVWEAQRNALVKALGEEAVEAASKPTTVNKPPTPNKPSAASKPLTEKSAPKLISGNGVSTPPNKAVRPPPASPRTAGGKKSAKKLAKMKRAAAK